MTGVILQWKLSMEIGKTVLKQLDMKSVDSNTTTTKKVGDLPSKFSKG